MEGKGEIQSFAPSVGACLLSKKREAKLKQSLARNREAIGDDEGFSLVDTVDI